MNGLKITMELLHFGIFSLVQQPLSLSYSITSATGSSVSLMLVQP